jgi:hypothetical protein
MTKVPATTVFSAETMAPPASKKFKSLADAFHYAMEYPYFSSQVIVGGVSIIVSGADHVDLTDGDVTDREWIEQYMETYQLSDKDQIGLRKALGQ